MVPRLIVAALALAGAVPGQQAPARDPIRVGIIGLDTSHVVAFTKAMNDPRATGVVARVRVVAAYPGGSPDLPASRDRLAGFTARLREAGVEIVATIASLLERVDAVLLESVDGRPHLAQARPVLEAHKPLFVDKPLAGSLEDAVAIFDLAESLGTPCFSSSSTRFSPAFVALRSKAGEVLGCDAYGPCPIEPHHPDLYWYGIHGVEILYTIMGPGCRTVRRERTRDFELVTGVWQDGRIGTYRGFRKGRRGYGARVFGTAAIAASGDYAGYGPLVEAIARFFLTGEPPVPAAETLEIYAFMTAADESLRRRGEAVSVREVLERARARVRRTRARTGR